MNNSNKKIEETSEEVLKEEKVEPSEDLPNEEIESNKNIEYEVESEELPAEDTANEKIELDSLDSTTDPIKESHEIESEEVITDIIGEEKLEMDGIESNIEIVEENNETKTIEEETVEKESLEEQMREFHKNLIEASLYAAGRPLTIEELSNKLEFPKKEVEVLLNEVAFDYLDRSTALIIAQIGERYQMQIKPEYTERVSKFAKGGAIAERYLRTLTVIALKQPILKSVVIKIRGSGAYEHVKYLIDNGFIDAIKKGRSHELTTTDKYADMFGLPKDKHLLKQAMVTQLGIEEGTVNEQSEENQEQDKTEQDEVKRDEAEQE
jgi:segregation and condensation protein B